METNYAIKGNTLAAARDYASAIRGYLAVEARMLWDLDLDGEIEGLEDGTPLHSSVVWDLSDEDAETWDRGCAGRTIARAQLEAAAVFLEHGALLSALAALSSAEGASQNGRRGRIGRWIEEVYDLARREFCDSLLRVTTWRDMFQQAGEDMLNELSGSRALDLEPRPGVDVQAKPAGMVL